MENLVGLHFAQKSSPKLKSNKDYIIEMAIQADVQDAVLATALSNFRIEILSHANLKCTGTLSGHFDKVTGLQFGKSDPNSLYSSSADATVRQWDIRQNGGKEAQSFKAPKGLYGGLLCMDVSHSDKILCAGSELIKSAGDDDKAHILFWDKRKSSLLGSYTESHMGDITQVKFKPGSDQFLLSASSDGLLCTYDLKHEEEQDAWQMTFNTRSDVARTGWCGDTSNSVYAVTTDSAFHMWDVIEGDNLCHLTDFETESKTPTDEDSIREFYLIDCIPEFSSTEKDPQGAVVVCGSHSGRGKVLHHQKDASVRLLTSLANGHSATIRCAEWHSKTKTLVTAGEDSLVCLWTARHSDQSSPTSKDTRKFKSEKKFNQKEKKPYTRHKQK